MSERITLNAAKVHDTFSLKPKQSEDGTLVPFLPDFADATIHKSETGFDIEAAWTTWLLLTRISDGKLFAHEFQDSHHRQHGVLIRRPTEDSELEFSEVKPQERTIVTFVKV